MTALPREATLLTPRALAAANINPATFLATDYLNHFNEVVMLMGLLPDMPDMLPDVLGWAPKSYAAHFADTNFQGRDLAIEAYAAAPRAVRKRFDAIVAEIDTFLLTTLAELEAAGPGRPLERMVPEAVRTLQALIETASAVINGTDDGAPADEDSAGEAQAAIDALFAAS